MTSSKESGTRPGMGSGGRRLSVGVLVVALLVFGAASGRASTVATVCPSGWATVPTPTVADPGNELFLDVTAVGTNDVWAVGTTQPAQGMNTPLAEHWDGTTWTRVPTPNPGAGSYSDLVSVAGSGPTDVWAVGAANGDWTQHWDGTTWTVAPATQGQITDVASAGPGDSWAIGSTVVNSQTEPQVSHWSGTAWVTVNTPISTTTDLRSISASSPNDVWVVGEDNQIVSTPVVAHWNGGSWTVTSLASVALAGLPLLASVSASGPGDVWILAETDGSTGTIVRYALHWDGGQWSRSTFDSLGPNAVVTSILALPTGGAIATGGYLSPSTGASALTGRWDGAQWAPEPPPVTASESVLDAAAAEPSGVRWVVGQNPTPHSSTLAARRCDGPNGPVDDPVARVAGADRIATAIAVSNLVPAASADAVVLSRSDTFADALAGAPLAGAKGGPILLTPPSSALDAGVLTEIHRVLPAGKTVFVLGGPASISPSVDSALTAAGYQVTRYQGPDRYGTAAAIASDGLGNPPTQVVANGLDFADALSGGAAAAHVPNGASILLTAGNTVPPATATYLAQHPGTRYAVGGAAAAALGSGATPIVGADRFDTAVRIAATFFSSPTGVIAVSGRTFPDALAGGALAARLGVPILLVEPGSVPPLTDRYVSANREPIQSGIVLGGTSSVSETTLAALRRSLS